jgi:hypothetical protein
MFELTNPAEGIETVFKSGLFKATARPWGEVT